MCGCKNGLFMRWENGTKIHRNYEDIMNMMVGMGHQCIIQCSDNMTPGARLDCIKCLNPIKALSKCPNPQCEVLENNEPDIGRVCAARLVVFALAC